MNVIYDDRARELTLVSIARTRARSHARTPSIYASKVRTRRTRRRPRQSAAGSIIVYTGIDTSTARQCADTARG